MTKLKDRSREPRVWSKKPILKQQASGKELWIGSPGLCLRNREISMNRKKEKPSMPRRFFACAVIGALVTGAVCPIAASPYVTLSRNFNRCSSPVLVREVGRATAANLDAAAYIGNPLRYDPKPESPKMPARKIGVAECTFGGAILAPCASILQTPLTESERERPLAWDALQNRLWELTKIDFFTKVTSAVNGWKWADSIDIRSLPGDRLRLPARQGGYGIAMGDDRIQTVGEVHRWPRLRRP